MKRIFKRAAAAVTVLSVMAAAVMFDVPERFLAIAAAEARQSQDCDVGHDGWESIADLSDLKDGKSYWLNNDVALESAIELDGIDVTLCLYGNKIDGQQKGNRIFSLKNGATLTLCDCKGGGMLTNVSFDSSDGAGGAVCVQSGCTFNMYGGAITNNNIKGDGGGVYTEGIFNMYGGEISDNTVTPPSTSAVYTRCSGGGVCVRENGAFIMTGGEISGNMASSAYTYGGGVAVFGGIFTLSENGTISNNRTSKRGAGVYVYTDGSFTMNGGKISDNNATTGTGVGGGVYPQGTFTMNGGTISDNEALDGGGVYPPGIFNMTNGTISGNTARRSGGGVWLNSGTFTMTGGTISGNNSLFDNYSNGGNNGGGVGVTNNGTFKINGKVEIKDNTKNTTADNDSAIANNVYLNSGKTIIIGNDFAADFPIGVNTTAEVTCGEPVNVTEFAEGVTAKNISASFTADIEGQSIVNSTENIVQLTGAHTATETKAKEATCTEDGNIKYWYCEKCGKYFSDEDCTTEITEDETVVPAAHKLEKVEGRDATCTQEGNKPHWKCTVCEKLFSDEEGANALTEDEIIISDPDAHDWGDWAMILEPTKTDKGEIKRICSINPEHVETNEIAELTDESLWELVASEEPSCTKDGYEIYESTYGRVTVKLPATGHNWDTANWSNDDTYHWRDCLRNCGEKKEEAAHIWNDGKITKQPTADEAGEKALTCTVCDKTKTVVIPATGGTGNPDPDNPDPDNPDPDNPDPDEPDPDDPDNENISKEVQSGENAPDIILATPLDELIEAVLTPEEQELADDGVNIKIVLTVEDGTNSVPAEDKAKVETAVSGISDCKIGQYLEVNLLKIIGDKQEQITETNAPITVVLAIPEALRGEGRTYSVVRIHNGEAAVLSDLDSDMNTVTIETDKFSTYALVYTEKTSVTPPDNGGSSGGNFTVPEGSGSGSGDTAPSGGNPADGSGSAPSGSNPADGSGSASSGSDPADGSDAASSENESAHGGNASSENGEASDNGTAAPSGGASSNSNNGVNSEIDTAAGNDSSSVSNNNNSNNPPTGVTISFIPLAAATVLMVTVKRKKK